MQWENVYVFISSTFNDMHAERDYLVKRVFPQLSAWCEARKLRLLDIDLRWGVTEQDSMENKRVLQVCLDRIDECRPFFLCFLGQRRGWVPQREDISAETFAAFERLTQGGYTGSTSVTEMEILHALIDPLHGGIRKEEDGAVRNLSPAAWTFFYLREDAYLDDINPLVRSIYTNASETDREEADLRLRKWREEIIPQSGRPFFSYRGNWSAEKNTPEIAWPYHNPTTAAPESIRWKEIYSRWKEQWESVGVRVSEDGTISDPGELEKAKAYNENLTKGRLTNFTCQEEALAEHVLDQLKDAIIRQFGERKPEEESALQKELDQQAQFLRLAGEGFIRRQEVLDPITDYLGNDDKRPMVITAEAGMGKSSLLAHFIEHYHTNEECKETLHYRFIGASDQSNSTEQLLRSVLQEISARGKLDGVPRDPGAVVLRLEDLLEQIGKNGKTILVFDGINQLESGMTDLAWIPPMLPQGIKLIVSFKRGEDSAEKYLEMVEKHDMAGVYKLAGFDSKEDRKKLVDAYLSQYFKELDESRIDALIESEGAENPLFLRTVLSELRVYGVHNSLTEMIKHNYGNTPASAFSSILERLENDAVYSEISPKTAVPRIFGWLAHSKYGLTVSELAELLLRQGLTESPKDAEDTVHLFLRQLRPYLARRDRRVDFFYESFQLAAVKRYTSEHPAANKAEEWHRSLASYFREKPADDRHRLMELAWQYACGDQAEELTDLLCSYEYVNTRLVVFDADALIDDYAVIKLPQLHMPQDSARDLSLIRDALVLSRYVLDRDPAQLSGQLWGRMADLAADLTDASSLENADDSSVVISKNSPIGHLLDQAKKQKETPWLRSLSTSMTAPGGDLVRTEDAVTLHCAFLSKDGKHYWIVETNWAQVKYCELDTGRPVRRIKLAAGDKQLSFAALDPQEKRLAMTAGDRGKDENEILYFDLDSGELEAASLGQGTKIWNLIFSGDGNRLASREDSMIRIWDTHTGLCLYQIKAEGDCSCFYGLPDGERFLYRVCEENHIYGFGDGKKLRTISRGEGENFTPYVPELFCVPGSNCHVRYLPGELVSSRGRSDTRFIGQDADLRFQLVDIDTGELVLFGAQPRNAELQWQRAVFAGNRLAVLGKQNDSSGIYLYQAVKNSSRAWDPVRFIRVPMSSLTTKILYDGRTLILEDMSFRQFFHAAERGTPQISSTLKSNVFALNQRGDRAIVTDSRPSRMYVTYGDRQYFPQIVRTGNRQIIGELEGKLQPFTKVFFLEDERYGAGVGKSDIFIYDLTKMKTFLHIMIMSPFQLKSENMVAFSPCGRYLFAVVEKTAGRYGIDSNHIVMIDVTEGVFLHEFHTAHKIQDLHVTPDGLKLVVSQVVTAGELLPGIGGKGGHYLSLWDLKTMELKEVFQTANEPRQKVILGFPATDRILLRTNHNWIEIWNLRSGSKLHSTPSKDQMKTKADMKSVFLKEEGLIWKSLMVSEGKQILISAFHISDHAEQRTLAQFFSEGIQNLCWNSEGPVVMAANDADRKVVFYRFENVCWADGYEPYGVVSQCDLGRQGRRYDYPESKPLTRMSYGKETDIGKTAMSMAPGLSESTPKKEQRSLPDSDPRGNGKNSNGKKGFLGKLFGKK